MRSPPGCGANGEDWGSQMSAAARLAAAHPQVGEHLRERYRVVPSMSTRITGHAQRIALSAMFGASVGESAALEREAASERLALTAVGDPIQSIYGWRALLATNLARFTTDFPRGRQPGADQH